jgi:2',3'-cyclic-nucleotide 2'-phosphodiesterase (5'-nucleotidase family)
VVRVIYYADVENAYDDPQRVGRLAGLVDRLGDPETLVCGGGDNTGPGVLSLKGDGFAALPFFRAVDPDADTLGNHEFDRTPEELLALVRESPQTWVCANARDGDDRFGAEAGIVPWTVFERGGERVGVFGVASPDTAEISPLAADLTFTDPVAAAREAVDALRERGVDHVVGLSHCGEDGHLARALDVPVVLGGHVHERREAVVDGTLLVRPGALGRRLVEVRVEEGTVSATWHEPAAADPDPNVVAAYRARRRELGLDEVVTTVDQPVERVASQGESAVGNFVADALRRAADADVGLMHGGSIRESDPLDGEVTVGDLVSLVPFENEVLAAEVTGADLLDAFRHAAAVHRGRVDPPRWYGQFSNASVVWDQEAAALREARVDGAPVDPDRTYRLGTLDYVVRDGGMFESLDGSVPTERVGVVHDALVAHAREAGIPTAPEGRVVRRNLPDGR